MGYTKIQWCEKTNNPIRARNKATGAKGWHCEKVSAGCTNCYSESINRRRGTGLPFKPGHRDDVEMFLDERMLTEPLRWKKPTTIFMCSMTDMFADFVPDEWLDKMFAVMALCPQHRFQLLTKRPKRMLQWFSEKWQPAPAQTYDLGTETLHVEAEKEGADRESQIDRLLDDWVGDLGLADPNNDAHWTADGSCKARQFSWPLPNVHIGVSVEDQGTANERIPLLLETPAAVRFVSYEPAIAGVDFTAIPLKPEYQAATGFANFNALTVIDKFGRNDKALHQIIIGGESGPGARPFDLAWARSTIRQCKDADVSVFVKQLGRRPVANGHALDFKNDPKGSDMDLWPKDLRIREFPK